ncbi:MAG: PqqD family protein [Acidimicrobiia bacterium]|nr:PqqD family protein [Acidimicrobiia bacterium]MDH5239139.1 PqqD family protein [Acidimicrobiia bacterium]
MIHRCPVFERWLMDGAVLIDPVHQPGSLRLDGSAAALWEALPTDGGAISRSDLVSQLTRHYDVSPERIADDVAAAVESLVQHGAAGRRG